jgi:MFS family permease
MNQTVDVFESKDYRRSRNAYRLECTFEYFVTLLVAGSFLATLLSSIGMSDSTIGIVSSLISLAFLVQLLSVFVVQRIANVKRFVILFHSVGQLGFMAIYLLPFLPFAAEYRKILVVICILFAYFGNYLVTSMLFKWGNSYVDPSKRASFSAGKEMISLASGVAVSWILGFIMDYFEKTNNLHGGFIFCAIAILIFCLCDFVTLLLIKNEITKKPKKQDIVPMREVMRETMGNRNFLSVLILTVIWNVASYTTVGFLGTYNIKELAFTVGTVQVISACGSAARFVVSKPFGRFSDKHSFAKGIELALSLALVAFLCLVFTTPSTRLLLIGYMVFHAFCMAGLNSNMMNIVYSYVDERYFVQASAIKNSIGGLCGFVTAILASRLLGYIQANGNMIFGIHIYGQQVLALISTVLVLVALIFTHFVIGKQKVMRQ